MKILNTKGFTLIELLIVIAIIAILAASALFQYSEYRMKASESSMLTDARNASTTMESIFSDCQNYSAGIANGGPGPVVATITGTAGNCNATNVNQTVRVSYGNTLSFFAAPNANSYSVQVHNATARPNRTNVSIDQAGNTSWF